MTKTHAKTQEVEWNNSSGESDDDNESDGQMGKKVDTNEVKLLKGKCKA
jgi:hypothetical protein